MTDNVEKLFTGERFVPGIADTKLEIEHFQRYLSIKELVRGKLVLDGACGEGYGSAILSETAEHVIGVDIDECAIFRAKEKYGSKPNLEYIKASIADLHSIKDHSLDIVVSFETIEHVPVEVQKKYLIEILRILKEDGLLVMSTPNKEIYSDLYEYQNEFHIKEFYKQEFLDFLGEKFKNIKLYNQYFEVSSIIDSNSSIDMTVNYYKDREKYKADGKYFIAIASNVTLPDKSIASVFMNEDKEYEKLLQRIFSLQDEVEERNVHLRKLDSEIEGLMEDRAILMEISDKQGREIVEKNQIIEQRSEDVVVCKKDISHLSDRLINQEKELLSISEIMFQQNDDIKSLTSEIGQLTAILEKFSGGIEQLTVNLHQHKRDVTSQATDLQRQNNHLQHQHNHLQMQNDSILQLIDKQKELQLKVDEYEHVKTTNSWKLIKHIQKTGDFTLPPNSRRRFLVRVMYNLVKNPKTMIKMLSVKRIKNYFKFMKLEGMEGVQQRYREALSLEQTRISSDESKEIDIMEIKSRNFEDYDIIEFEEFANPKISIIIPVYNEFEYTYNCLESIKKNSGDVTYEIIIGNDNSNDLTTRMDEIITGITIVNNKENLRFLKNCNSAATYAKGKYILFLNNDTQVQENWLKPLVSIMETDNTIGLTGSKLVYANGMLQEAGGIFWKDASAWNYGNKSNPEEPEFNYLKEVDYISGASIMIRTELWKEIGGFDERFAPAYYEDADLAFEVRKKGYRVVYQPLSVVVHFEGVSNGTDTSSGQKQYQILNKDRFYEKWKEILEKEHFPNAENVLLARDRSRKKKHILIVDHYIPHYDKDAGGKCTFMYTSLFARMGYQVTFIGDNFFRHEPYTTELQQKGIEVVYGNYYYKNWKTWLKENVHSYDYVYLNRPHIASKYIDIVKKYSTAKIVYFGHDLHYLREYRQYLINKNPELLKSSEEWKEKEFELFGKADVIHVVGTYEQEILQKEFKDKPVRNIPLYIYENLLTDINKDFSQRKDIIFVGGFGHPPNIDAVLWFGKEIFPKVLEKHPEIKWYVVGSKVTPEIQALASENIIIKGFVPDEELEKLYRECRLAVVPLRVGAGVKGKVVEAAYYQIPLVTTTIGGEGLSVDEGAFIMEDDASKMADIINVLYGDFNKLEEISNNEITFIDKSFMIKRAREVLKLDFEEC